MLVSSLRRRRRGVFTYRGGWGTCCCTSGQTCAACTTIPNTLTFSYTFTTRPIPGGCTTFSSSCGLTFTATPPSGWVGTMNYMTCATCVGCTAGSPPNAVGPDTVRMTCAPTLLQLGWDAAPGITYQIHSTLFPGSDQGTFTCSPFLWTYTCPTTACQPFTCQQNCWYLSNATISA